MLFADNRESIKINAVSESTHIQAEYKMKILPSFLSDEDKNAFRDGMRDGIPIGLGYFAVAFSLGIAARAAGLSPFQGFLASALCNASAGEYAGFTLIAASSTLVEMACITLIANARYLLMSFAYSQKMKADLPLRHRLPLAFYLTDEFFAISIARPGWLNPWYTYGAVCMAAPCWATGTALGVIAGAMLPVRVVSAFSVALYGMFLAVIIPPARKEKVIAAVIAVCFAASYAAAHLPLVSEMSGGTRIIMLTVLISSCAALLCPKTDSEKTGDGEGQKGN